MASKPRAGAVSAPDGKPAILPSLSADVVLPLRSAPARGPSTPVIIVGASTGGTEALKQFLGPMPSDGPPVLIAQHMPEMFTATFAARLDAFCAIKVKEAIHGEPVLPGHAYIAPGHSHLMLAVKDGRYICELSRGQPVNRHRPAVDVLFRSAANVAGKHATGVILTGMGKDGAVGMLEMRRAGAYNFAQDEATCVVFGMPKEAILNGAAHEVAPLDSLAERVLAHVATAFPKVGRAV